MRRRRCREKTTVTNRMTTREGSAIKEQIQQLIARHLTVLPCPLDPEDVIQLWLAQRSTAECNAHAAVRRWIEEAAASANPLSDDHSPFKEGIVTPVTFELHDGVRLVLQVPFHMMAEANIPLWHAVPTCFVQANAVLPPEKYAKFDEWVRRAVHTFERVLMTTNIVNQIVDMAGTVGQLHRMAPDLVKYTSVYTRQALETQERRSPLPEAWMQTDRTAVRASMDHLGLCHLLKKPEADLNLGDVVHSALWPWTGPWITHSHYENRPPQDLYQKLSTYILPFDTNPVVLGRFVTGRGD